MQEMRRKIEGGVSGLEGLRNWLGKAVKIERMGKKRGACGEMELEICFSQYRRCNRKTLTNPIIFPIVPQSTPKRRYASVAFRPPSIAVRTWFSACTFCQARRIAWSSAARGTTTTP